MPEFKSSASGEWQAVRNWANIRWRIQTGELGPDDLVRDNAASDGQPASEHLSTAKLFVSGVPESKSEDDSGPADVAVDPNDNIDITRERLDATENSDVAFHPTSKKSRLWPLATLASSVMLGIATLWIWNHLGTPHGVIGERLTDASGSQNVEQLSDKIEELEKELNAVNMDLRNSRDNLDNAEANANKARADLARALQAQRNIQDTTLGSLSYSEPELTEQITERDETIAALKENIETDRARYSALNTQLKVAERNATRQKSEYDELERELKNVQDQLNTSQTTIRTLNNRLANVSPPIQGPIVRENTSKPIIVDAIRIKKVVPNYPRRAREREVEATYIATFDVSTSGQPINIEVIRESGSSYQEKDFDRSIREALKSTKYSPRKENGKAVIERGVTLTFPFKMAD